MKLSCKVIEDLLPMYYDKVCSEETAALVEEHLKDCPDCSRILSDLRGEIEIPAEKPDDIKPLKTLQKSYKKKKLIALIAILLIVAMIPVAFLFGNKQGEQGVQPPVFDEDDALAKGNAFMSAMISGDYEEAFSHVDLKERKRDWLRDPRFDEEDLVNLEKDALKKFADIGAELEAAGGIDDYENKNVSFFGYYNDKNMYGLQYIVKFQGEDVDFNLTITENGIRTIVAADGLIEHPLSQIALWGHWLWEDYLDSYYDPNLGEFVFYDD